MFMKAYAESEPKVRNEYLKKLERIHKARFIKVADFSEEFRLGK